MEPSRSGTTWLPTYGDYVTSFVSIREAGIREKVDAALEAGLLWPEPRVGINPAFQPGGTVDDLVEEGILHPECKRIFRIRTDSGEERPLHLHRHQDQAIRAAHAGDSYLLTTGTGSGKSLTYIIPIVDLVLREGPGKGVKAIVVYPMNALEGHPTRARTHRRELPASSVNRCAFRTTADNAAPRSRSANTSVASASISEVSRSC